MTVANQFIAELIRAANGVGKLSDDDRRRLLKRAIVIIRDLGQEIEAPKARIELEAITEVQVKVAELAAAARTSSEVSECMLFAATMIRDLQIEISRLGEPSSDR